MVRLGVRACCTPRSLLESRRRFCKLAALALAWVSLVAPRLPIHDSSLNFAAVWRTCQTAFQGHGRRVDRRAVADEDYGASHANLPVAWEEDPPTRDWREFRAMLVEDEAKEQLHARKRKARAVKDFHDDQHQQQRGWVYSTPLIEQGTVLVAKQGLHFSLRQQYFHKAVILVIQHNDEGTVGLILNRPTALQTEDVRLKGGGFLEDLALRLTSWLPGAGDWNLWFGGDCGGMNSDDEMFHFCLHRRSDLAEYSMTITTGVYATLLSVARTLVATGKAERGDFLVLVGYCGWKPGQLQKEVDAGESWHVAAADARALFGDTPFAHAGSFVPEVDAVSAAWAGTREAMPAKVQHESPRRQRRLPQSRASVVSVPSDGIEQWSRLHESLLRGEAPQQQGDCRLDQDCANPSEEDCDAALRYWIETHLMPKPAVEENSVLNVLGLSSLRQSRQRQHNPPVGTEGFHWAPRRVRGRYFHRLHRGTVLRASATAWVLGSPENSPIAERAGFAPAQYMHKAVFLLISEWVHGSPAFLTLLTGPQIGYLKEESMALYYGGHVQNQNRDVLQEPSGLVIGQVKLPPYVLEELLENGGLTVAREASRDLDKLLSAPRHLRWEVAGGNISSIKEASVSVLGDHMRRCWYRRVMKIDLDE